LKHGRTRVVAICLFARGDQILVMEGFDATKGSPFYRPLGGGVEFGETTRAALVREMREELGQEVRGLRLVGTLESLFELEGVQGHEIVFVYNGEFVDPTVYECDRLTFEEDNGEAVTARWRRLDFFDAYHRLVPEQLHRLISDGKGTQ
jgi:ADP-ribose pyrophosphatase YjhB (NUDIX family)